MTRINTVPVESLSDKHLLAEYKEITRPFNKAKKHIDAGKKPGDLNIPSEYCLGTGHETFFFDKLSYIHTRYIQLFYELKARHVNVDQAKFDEFNTSVLTYKMQCKYKNWFKNYEPTPEAIYLNMARLVIRSNFSSDKAELKRAFINSELELI